MYKDFFGLQANPFNVNPDPHYLFLTPHTEEALACMIYGVENRKGFILLTGEVGTGKTTLVNQLLSWLEARRIRHSFVFHTQLNVPQFFEFVMADFGVPFDADSKSRTLIGFYQWLMERYRAGENAVLVVDEAQNLSDEIMEEIRLMTNFETPTTKLLQIVLVGQPELEEKLAQPHLRQLRQRVTLKAKTRALSLDETKSYVKQRLHIAGANGNSIFDDDAITSIHRHSSGIPRVVNLICEHCMVNAFVDEKKVVGQAMVEEAARDYGIDAYTVPRPVRTQPGGSR